MLFFHFVSLVAGASAEERQRVLFDVTLPSVAKDQLVPFAISFGASADIAFEYIRALESEFFLLSSFSSSCLLWFPYDVFFLMNVLDLFSQFLVFF